MEKISTKVQDYLEIEPNRLRICYSEDKQWGFGCFGIMVLIKQYGLEEKKRAN